MSQQKLSGMKLRCKCARVCTHRHEIVKWANVLEERCSVLVPRSLQHRDPWVRIPHCHGSWTVLLLI